MKAAKNAWKIALAFVCVIAAAGWLVSSTGAADRTTLEIHPDHYVAGYQSDTVRVMDAYERLMDRYMYMVEENLKSMTTDTGMLIQKLDSIDRKMDALGVRISKIEKALDVPQTKKAGENK